MNRILKHLYEDFDPAIYNSDGNISIDDPEVVDGINASLEASTSCACRTPYISLEEIRKVLAYYKIFLPKSGFLDQNHGYDVFEISQFGEKTGMNNNGEVVTASNSPLFLYFEWSMNEKGMYDTFASVVNQEELDEILADYEAEVEDDETDLHEAHSAAHLSKTVYALINKKMAEKQGEDVEDYEEHEKQGKTFTQVHEMAMPNVSKRMGAKKVTLRNMNKEETQLDELKASTARSAEHKAAEKYYTDYGDESDARKEYLRKRSPEAREKVEAAKAKREKSKNRVIRFQKYADKKEAEEKLSEDAAEEARQKRLSKLWGKDPKPKKKGKMAELMAGWPDEIRQMRARRKEWDKEKESKKQ